MSKNDFPIDFVVPWVDGSDPEWIVEFNKYAPKEKQRDIDIGEQRYRDYGLLRYWFRGVEKFAPWVNKVHFITCGQKPDWLNLDNPKLHWVKHSDYIPADCLPVFSANPIELYMHKIEGLSEHFVYFNDDFYLTDSVTPDFFFRKGLPCDSGVMNAESGRIIQSIVFNDIKQINSNFNKKTVLKKYFWYWFNPKYGKFLVKNFCLIPWKRFTGFWDPHVAASYTKTLLNEVWDNCAEILNDTMHSKFRKDTDVNQWLFRYWNLCKGNFYPIHPMKGKKRIEISEDTNLLCSLIKDKKYKEVILNDDSNVHLTQEEFIVKMQSLSEAFDSILPEKSSFEL